MILHIANHMTVVYILLWCKSQLQEHWVAYEKWTKCIFVLKIDSGALNVVQKILGNSLYISFKTSRLLQVQL